MRIIALAAAVAALSIPSIANAAECRWPTDKPAKQAYRDIEGRVTSVSSQIVTDDVFGRGRKFIYTISFGRGSEPYTSWTFMSADTPANTIAVRDSFVWQYSSDLTNRYGHARYVPMIIGRGKNGVCKLIGTDFSRPASDIPI